MSEYERHSLSSPFGEASQYDFEELVASMRERGYDPSHPIILYEGQILDGWHRYLAAKKARVEAAFREFIGSRNEASNFAFSENMARRHMNQRQKIAAFHLRNLALQPKERLTDVQIQAKVGARSAKMTTQLRKVVESSPEKAHQVVEGTMNATDAIRDVLNETPEGSNDGPIRDASGNRTQWTLTLRKKSLVEQADELRTKLRYSDQRFINKATELFIEWAKEESDSSD